jgi:hypothetical protein
VVFALLVFVRLCSLVSLSLLLDLFLPVGRVIWTIFIVFLPMELFLCVEWQHLRVVVDWWFSVVVMARTVVLAGCV